MNETEFIEKMRKLDPFYHEGEVELDTLYSRFETVVREMERLEDIEDNTAMMQAGIDELMETVRELREQLKRSEQNEPK